MRFFRINAFRQALALIAALLVAGCGNGLRSDAVAFDQLELVHDCGFAPKDCDGFFGPAGFERAYKRSMETGREPGDQETDSMPSDVWRFAYYGQLRRVEDHYAQTAIIADLAKDDVAILDLREKLYVRLRGEWLRQIKDQWANGQTFMRRTINPEFWHPKPHTSSVTSLPPMKIGGIPSQGRSVTMAFDWMHRFELPKGTVTGRATARAVYTIYEASDLEEPCPTFHLGPETTGSLAMGFCGGSQPNKLVLYFRENVTDQNRFANIYPSQLVVERGHFRSLGASDLSIFQVPSDFRDECKVKASVELTEYC